MQRKLSFLLVVGALASAGCARGPAPATASGDRCETGDATYYSDALAGRRTASGDKYDPRANTAAHRTARFGSSVVVVWGDRRTVVRVNDRGPFSRGGVIDLSRAAAEELGIMRAGRVRVRVCPVEG